jgi:DNA-binding protein H-NS
MSIRKELEENEKLKSVLSKELYEKQKADLLRQQRAERAETYEEQGREQHSKIAALRDRLSQAGSNIKGHIKEEMNKPQPKPKPQHKHKTRHRKARHISESDHRSVTQLFVPGSKTVRPLVSIPRERMNLIGSSQHSKTRSPLGSPPFILGSRKKKRRFKLL